MYTYVLLNKMECYKTFRYDYKARLGYKIVANLQFVSPAAVFTLVSSDQRISCIFKIPVN